MIALLASLVSVAVAATQAPASEPVALAAAPDSGLVYAACADGKLQPRINEYTTATALASVAVKIPPTIPPITITMRRRLGIARKKARTPA